MRGRPVTFFFFFFNDTATTEIYTFPYTTLFRSPGGKRLRQTAWPSRRVRSSSGSDRGRSEEHTSELQSPCNLVCRLLLEKKNQHLRHAPQQITHSLGDRLAGGRVIASSAHPDKH